MIVQVKQASRRDGIEDYFGSLDYTEVEYEKWEGKIDSGYAVEVDCFDDLIGDLDYEMFVIERANTYCYDNADWVLTIYNNYIE